MQARLLLSPLLLLLLPDGCWGILKGVPPCLTPELLHVLNSMGHGDRIVLADTNFPSASICAKGARHVRADGLTIPVLMEAILQLMPLELAVAHPPVMLMDLVKKDQEAGMEEPPVWATYQKLIDASEGTKVKMTRLEQSEFYKQAKNAYAVVHTGETALYGNIMLEKGLVKSEPKETATEKYEGSKYNREKV